MLGILVVVFIASLYFEVFNVFSFLGIMVVVLSVVAGGIALNIYDKMKITKDIKDENSKVKISNIFRRINEELATMPDGDTVNWDSGKSRTIKSKIFSDGKKNWTFRAYFGTLVTNNELVVVIYDVDNDTVFDYYTNPGPDLLLDPFKNFNPIQSNVSDDLLLRRALLQRKYGQKGRKLVFNIGDDLSTGGGTDSDSDEFTVEPDSELVDKAIGGSLKDVQEMDDDT